MDKATSNHAFCSTDTPTSVSLSWFSWLKNFPASSCPLVSIRGSYSFRHFVPFVLFVVKYSLRPFVSIRVHSCPFVVQTIPCHRYFVPFVYFVLFVVKYSLRPFVSIRVHSWFISFRPFVVHILSIPSCPFVAPKDHSAIKKQTGHPRKIIKKVYISTCYSKT